MTFLMILARINTGVASSILEEVDGGIVGRLNICFGGNAIEDMHHGIVNWLGIEEKFSGYSLEEFYFLQFLHIGWFDCRRIGPYIQII